MRSFPDQQIEKDWSKENGKSKEKEMDTLKTKFLCKDDAEEFLQYNLSPLNDLDLVSLGSIHKSKSRTGRTLCRSIA